MSDQLPSDDYSKMLRQCQGNPSAVEKTSMIEMSDFLGNSVTWFVKTIRTDGADVVFLQRVKADGGDRFVLPPEVTDCIARQRGGIVDVNRKRAAHRAAATRKAKG